MDFKIWFKLLVVILITVLPLQANISTVINLAISGSLLTVAGITGMQAKKSWQQLKEHQAIVEAKNVTISSGQAVKSLFTNDQRALNQSLKNVKESSSRLIDNAGPITFWAIITVVCAGLGLKLFLASL
jgi:hypothetical protein